MTLAEKKINLISWLTNLNDDKILDHLNRIREKTMSDRYSPMTEEEYKSSLNEAEEDYKAGRIVGQEELKKRVLEGRLL